MIILVTGTPGVGKSTVAKYLGKLFKLEVINELDFALKRKIGKYDHETKELAVEIKDLQAELQKYIKKHKKCVIEGHLLCETKLKGIDYVIVVQVHPEILEVRLEFRNYPQEKIMDNVFCEGIDYCKKHAKRNYAKKQLICVHNEKTIKDTMYYILNELKKRGVRS